MCICDTSVRQNTIILLQIVVGNEKMCAVGTVKENKICLHGIKNFSSLTNFHKVIEFVLRFIKM